MATTPISTSKFSAALPIRRWWLSLYPRLSAKGKRGMMVVCLGAAMVAQSVGLMDSTTRSQSPYDNPAVQNPLRQLDLSVANDPIGSQFQVNTYTTNLQVQPAVAMDSDGDFVVVWFSAGSNGSDSDGPSIQGQRYNPAGIPQGSEFQVNSYTTNDQHTPAVSMDSDGNFVVVWVSNGSQDGDNDSFSIQGQRYNSAGIPQGSQFQVNSYTTGDQHFPAVAMDNDGDFVVTWTSGGSSGTDTSGSSIQGKRYNAAGAPQGDQFQINNYTTGDQYFTDVALDDDGDFVVIWESLGSSGTDTSQNSIQGQRYNSSGVPQGSQFQVNSYTTDKQRHPDVALDSDGDFVVAWQSSVSPGNDNGYPGQYSIQGQRFNAAGTAQGSQFQVNTYTTGHQRSPAVSFDSDGDFLIVWYSNGSSGDDSSFYSIQRQAYNAAGTPQGNELQVNSYTSNGQAEPDVAHDSNGNFVVVWSSSGSSGTDTSTTSIQGQRFTAGSAGGDFQINSYTTNWQKFPAVAADSDGDFVVVWMSYGSDDDIYGNSIQGQRYNAAGEPQGEQFQANNYTSSEQRYPDVAMDSDGDFVIVWHSLGSNGNDNSDSSIQGQRYNSLGVPQGGQFQINNYTTSWQEYPAVSMDSDGDFVVVWQSFGSSGSDSDDYSIQGRRYNSAGTAQGSQFQVNSYTTDHQRWADVALDSDGDFVVVWTSDGSSGTDTSDWSIQGQRYNAAGTTQGNEFQINSYTSSIQSSPSVSLDSDGDFVVVWHSNGSGGNDNDYTSIQGRRYNAAGTPESNDFQVNTYTALPQRNPAVSVDSDGDFVVTWDGDTSGGNDNDLGSIQGQAYNAAGVPQGGEFQINSYTTNGQHNTGVALDSDGDFVVVWDSEGSSGSDSDSYSIQGQRFVVQGTTPTPTPSPTNTATPTPTNTPTPTSTPEAVEQSLYLPAVISDSSP